MVKTARAVSLVIALGIGGLEAPAQAQQEEIEVRVTELAQGVHMLMGRGGNIAVSSGEDGVFMVDADFAPLTEKIIAAVATFTDKPIQYVINTHWHGDHTRGNENIANAGAIIIAHENVRIRLNSMQEMGGREIPPMPESALPVITFTRDLRFHLNGDELDVFHVEHAHTDGDAMIHFKNSNVIHMGDTFFNGMFPFIDIEHGGSIDGTIAAARMVLEMVDDETKIVPGHGPLGNRADLQTYLDMLSQWRSSILAEVESGKSVAEVVAADPLAEYGEEWATSWMPVERFTRILATDLSSK